MQPDDPVFSAAVDVPAGKQTMLANILPPAVFTCVRVDGQQSAEGVLTAIFQFLDPEPL